jgi:hypothetical protein
MVFFRCLILSLVSDPSPDSKWVNSWFPWEIHSLSSGVLLLLTVRQHLYWDWHSRKSMIMSVRDETSWSLATLVFLLCYSSLFWLLWIKANYKEVKKFPLIQFFLRSCYLIGLLFYYTKFQSFEKLFRLIYYSLFFGLGLRNFPLCLNFQIFKKNRFTQGAITFEFYNSRKNTTLLTN